MTTPTRSKRQFRCLRRRKPAIVKPQNAFDINLYMVELKWIYLGTVAWITTTSVYSYALIMHVFRDMRVEQSVHAHKY